MRPVTDLESTQRSSSAERPTNGAEALAEEAETWIVENLGWDYEWPGNFRELEQCLRSLLVRRHYTPARPRRITPRERILEEIASGSLTAEQLLSRYCTLVYAGTRNYQESARRLNLDHRTVKSRIDRMLLDELVAR